MTEPTQLGNTHISGCHTVRIVEGKISGLFVLDLATKGKTIQLEFLGRETVDEAVQRLKELGEVWDAAETDPASIEAIQRRHWNERDVWKQSQQT